MAYPEKFLMILIYQIINKHNGKAYIGKTSTTMRIRWAQHRSEAKRGSKRHFCCAIRKYGVDAFEVRVIDQASTDERASEFEKYYIKLFDTQLPSRGYNIQEGGRAFCRDLAAKRRSDIPDDEIAQLYGQGLSCRKIGELFSMSWSGINMRLLKRGVRMRPRSEQRGDRRLDICNEEVVRLYEQEKLSCVEIAKLFSTNDVTIHKRLRKMSAKMRPVGRRPMDLGNESPA